MTTSYNFINRAAFIKVRGLLIIIIGLMGTTVFSQTPETAEDEKIYTAVEIKPEFPGGMHKLYVFVMENFKVPEDKKISGKLIMPFVVEKDGSLSNITAFKDLGFGTADEAVRMLKTCPEWKPGTQDGKPVRVLYTLPISITTDG